MFPASLTSQASMTENKCTLAAATFAQSGSSVSSTEICTEAAESLSKVRSLSKALSDATSVPGSECDADVLSNAGSSSSDDDTQSGISEAQDEKQHISMQRMINSFVSVSEPPISIEDYLQRLWKHCKCSDSCHILALIYIDRLIETCPNMAVTPLTIHRLFATATVVSAKIQDDDSQYPNSYYAKVCGLSVLQLNSMEANFMSLVAWNLFVHQEEYDERLNQVESLCASWGLPAASVIAHLAMH
eukprot:TRINITY_DN26599_c0_g1_i1.p1 TRINITY_DN26599_c0_g1~~TRINITY_DN26599_c0_g1_i1.p1  ORF type:complete len:286 (+),score=47.38 TRINITY_DN26599_c0_g1_i1:124-858(+)